MLWLDANDRKSDRRNILSGEFDDLPSYKLGILQSLSEEYQAQELALIGLKWLEAQVLGACSERPHSFQEICQKTRLDKAAVSRTIRRLTADGYLNRLDDPARRRSFFAELTPKGAAARDQLFARAQARNERWLSILGPKDAARFPAMLDTLEGRLREMLTEEQLTPARAILPKSARKRSAPVDLDLVKQLHAALGKVLGEAAER